EQTRRHPVPALGPGTGRALSPKKSNPAPVRFDVAFARCNAAHVRFTRSHLRETFMAQRVQDVLIDDIDGGEAAETVSFSLDGVSYEIDLSAEHASELRESFARWVGHARRVSGRAARGRRGGGGGGRTPSGESAAIREWARENG